MTAAQSGRYSKYIRPISIVFDLFAVAFLGLFYFKGLRLNLDFYIGYLLVSWILIAFLIKFYDVYRFTTPVEILTKITKQTVLFSLLIIAFFPFSTDVIFSESALIYYVSTCALIITIFKVLLFYYLGNRI